MRLRKVALSSRGIYEPVLSEEDALGLIRNWLEVVLRARVFRAVERVPRCYRCGLRLGSSEAGTPDISGYIPAGPHTPSPMFNFPFWFEVKAKKHTKRPMQVARIESIRSDGGCAAFVTSIEEVAAELRRCGVKVPNV